MYHQTHMKSWRLKVSTFLGEDHSASLRRPTTQTLGEHMRTVLVALFLVFATSVHAGEWKKLVGYSLHDIYEGKFKELEKASNVRRETEVISTNGLSWQDGRQAIVIYLETKQAGKKWLYKCIDYFTEDMQQTGQMCYELRK